jgi:sugar O-acyltransferase (sialic acid O-acetyltransferase NeuD family)
MDLVIFGLGQQSSLAWYVYTNDSPHRVVAFTADASHCDRAHLHGCPVVAFENLASRFPPGSSLLSIPIGWRGMNALRRQRLEQARRMGYGFASYVSSRALVCPDLLVGENTMIHDGVIVQPFARIGSNCMLRAGSIVSHHAVIGDHCFVAAGAMVAGAATIGEACVLGLGCAVRDGVRVAPRCFLGAGAVVQSDTSENGVYTGSPARRRAQPADALDTVQWAAPA